MKKESWWQSSDRYCFDFSKEYKNGWRQYDTDQDAHYFGVWYNPETMQTLCYCEGDISLRTYDIWDEFIAQMKELDKFHGGRPPSAIVGDGIDVNMRVINAHAIFDPDARWDYETEQEPEHREPTPAWMITMIFNGAGDIEDLLEERA